MATEQMVLMLQPERARLSNQCSMILGRLMQGRATNRELSGISLKYTSRNSDLRQRGHDIRIVHRNRTTGLVWYALFVDGREHTELDSRTDVEKAVDELTFVGAHRR